MNTKALLVVDVIVNCDYVGAMNRQQFEKTGHCAEDGFLCMPIS